jgi:aminopeptidase
MSDPRVSKLAQILVHYSTRVQKGDKVLIRGFPLEPMATPLIVETFREILKAGGHPHFFIDPEDVWYYFYKEASDFQLLEPDMFIEYASEHIDVDIRMSCIANRHILSNIDPGKLTLTRKANSHIWDKLASRSASGDLRWVVVGYPSQSMAEAAAMSQPEYEDFFYKATFVDADDPIQKYSELGSLHSRLIDWLKDKNQVHLEGEEIDLRMSIKGRTFINCAGETNIPDGEIFTGPIEDSVEGQIRLSYPCIYGGKEVEGVELVFKSGKVVKATADSNQEYLQETINTDDGASFVGEFGIGTNFEINQFTKNMLFDEKLGGTIHLALGSGYPESGSKNKSAIHWDLLADMYKGRITIDGDLFYESGQFMI